MEAGIRLAAEGDSLRLGFRQSVPGHLAEDDQG